LGVIEGGCVSEGPRRKVKWTAHGKKGGGNHKQGQKEKLKKLTKGEVLVGRPAEGVGRGRRGKGAERSVGKENGNPGLRRGGACFVTRGGTPSNLTGKEKKGKKERAFLKNGPTEILAKN